MNTVAGRLHLNVYGLFMNIVIILMAIIGVSSLVCIVIICVGVTWLCRYKNNNNNNNNNFTCYELDELERVIVV